MTATTSTEPRSEPQPADRLNLVQLPSAAKPGRNRRSVPRGVRKLYGPILLLLVWQIGSGTGVVDAELFPPPIDVARAAGRLIADGELQLHVWASLQRVLYGLALGIAGGALLAVLSGLTRIGEDFIDSTMQVFKAVPNFALTPLLIIWMGIGEGPKVVLIALGTGIAIYINTYSAIRGVDSQLIEAALTLEASRLTLITHVILPGSLPGFLVGLRLALSNAWLSLIFAETINTTQGIGFLMTRAQTLMQFDVSVLILLLYAAIGLLSYALVRFLERRLLSWRLGFEGV